MGGWGALVIMQLHCESLQNCKIEVKREGFYLSLFLSWGGGVILVYLTFLFLCS